MSNNLGVIKENIRTKFEQINEEKLNSISEFIKNNGQHQKIDNYFVFRLFNSVSQREEVFIGNVLFNDYISKLLLRTYEAKDKYYGQMELVYNDLENFYYVVKQDDFSLEELEADFKDFFAEHLEELFFDDEDLEKGIYGDFDNKLLKFSFSNRDVFPVFCLPKAYKEKLLNKVIKLIYIKLFDSNIYPTEIASNLAYFFGTNYYEWCSYKTFIYNFINKSNNLRLDELKNHLEIKKFGSKPKDKIQKQMQKKKFKKINNENQLKFRQQLFTILKEIKHNFSKSFYFEDKMVELNPEKYVNLLVNNIFNPNKFISNHISCTICGNSIIEERIIRKGKNYGQENLNKEVHFGEKASKFINRGSKIKIDDRGKGKTVCLKCLLSSFLKDKFLGTQSETSDNILPEKRNIVFFYGNIPEERVNQIQGVLNSLYYCTQNPSVYTYEMIDESIEELEKDNLEEQNYKADDLLKELIESDQKNKKEKPAKVPPTIWSWYKNGQQDNKVNTHIFSVGQGKNRLYTFVLPYALSKSEDIQKKYSQNKVAVYSMLSFLSRLTGVKGMFYYLSTPKLKDEFTKENIFYYKDEPKEGSLKEYELLTEVAWKLVNPNNVSGRTYSDRLKNAFERRLKLAKNLNKLPLITISKIYRELISKNKSNYKNLSSIKNMGMINLFPLIKISNSIRKFKNDKEGIKFMGKEIQTEKFEQFVYQFFGELLLIDGVFPQGFGAKPTEFEKYPRLFIKNILKTNLKEDEEKKDVLAGFKIWSNKMLHSRNNFYRGKEFITERMFEIKKLLVDDEYKDILSDKNNLIYFKRSLFGWLSEFLYPIYSLRKKINLNKSSDIDKIRATIEEKIETPTPEVEKVISYIMTSKNADIILEYAKKYLINKFYSKNDEEDE